MGSGGGWARGLLVLCLASSAAWAHELSFEVAAGPTSASTDNPRVGNVGLAAGGTFEPSDAWAVFANAQYTRDLPTKTDEYAASGSDIFLFSLGASWAPSEHWLTLFELLGSPPAKQVNTTAVTLAARTADVRIDATTWTAGAQWTLGWMSAGDSAFESGVDLGLGVTELSNTQKAMLGTTARANALRALCQLSGYRQAAVCRLIAGASTPLTQGKASLGYTAMLGRTDLSLSATYYLYDKDPDQVGFFSLVALGRAELGSGVPTLPLLVSVRPSLSHHLGRLTLRVAYQLGVYHSGDGLNHLVLAKASWKATDALRLYLSLTGQLDTGASGVMNLGGTAVLGTAVSW